MRHADAEAVKPLLTDGGEIALIDVREHGQYGEGHPFFSVNLPYSRLETLAPAPLPRRSVRCVLFDDGDGVAEKAARRLAVPGYDDRTVMSGGGPAGAAQGWSSEVGRTRWHGRAWWGSLGRAIPYGWAVTR